MFAHPALPWVVRRYKLLQIFNNHLTYLPVLIPLRPDIFQPDFFTLSHILSKCRDFLAVILKWRIWTLGFRGIHANEPFRFFAVSCLHFRSQL